MTCNIKNISGEDEKHQACNLIGNGYYGKYCQYKKDYITEKNIRFSSDCSKCEKINHFFDKETFIKK